MSRDFDVVIIGAGAAGTAMASLLLERRIAERGRVAIVADRLPAAPAAAADWDLRVVALSRASQRLLQACGIWQRLPAQRLCAYERMCVWDSGGAPGAAGSLTFDCAEIGEPNLGYIVEVNALQWCGREAATALGAVILEAGVKGLGVDEAQARIELDDGRELRAALAIGADGADSHCRRMLGIDAAGHAYHQDALVAHIATERGHQNTAWQRFLPTGPLAFLPLPDGRSSIVWSAARAEADRLRALDAEAFGAAVTAASDGVLGAARLTTPVAGYPLRLQYATDYVRPHAVLLGDAAHAVHPLAGQGLNLGLLDCGALAEVLEAEGAGQPLGDLRTLRRYERWRKSENLAALAAMDALERLFSNDHPALRGLRSAGLEMVGKLPMLKRQFARRALGLAGDVPRFLTGDRASPRR